MEAEGQHEARRLVRVRKRKVLADHSNIFQINKENAPPQIKRVKQPFKTTLTTSKSAGCNAVIDWGLKTKARFISINSFNWAKQKGARQESQGLSAFLKGHTELMDTVSELQAQLLYWEHPSVPTLSLFSEDRHRASVSAALKETAFADALKEDWLTSFRSLFQLFRLGTCSHFYLCAPSLTILFVTSNPSSPRAVISPTTSGFRRALNREGVEFNMPLGMNQSPTEELHETESDEECSDWIDSVISTEKRTAKKINVKSTQHQGIDGRPESTVLVPYASLQSLFNYLLNCKTLVSPTGPLAGVPPTLISPVAFQGATLRTLKVSVGTMSVQGAQGLTQKHYMDVCGPLLPHALRDIRIMLTPSHSELSVHTVESNHSSAFNRALGQYT